MDKEAIRAAHRDRRRQRRADLAGAAPGLARELVRTLTHFRIELPPVVAGYLPVRNEPDVTAGMAQLLAKGSLIVVPKTLEDCRLEWRTWTPSAPLAPDRHGLLASQEPPRVDVLHAAGTVVLVPALAVDRLGHRLGQGAGYYDRALADLPRWPIGALRIAVVYADEVVGGRLPREPHDEPVDAVLTPEHWFDCLAR